MKRRTFWSNPEVAASYGSGDRDPSRSTTPTEGSPQPISTVRRSRELVHISFERKLVKLQNDIIIILSRGYREARNQVFRSGHLTDPPCLPKLVHLIQANKKDILCTDQAFETVQQHVIRFPKKILLVDRFREKVTYVPSDRRPLAVYFYF